MNAFFFTISRNRNKPFTLHAKNSYHDFTQQKTVIPEFTQKKGNSRISAGSPMSLDYSIHLKIHLTFRLALGNQRFPVRIRLLPVCRGELPAVTGRLMSKCL